MSTAITTRASHASAVTKVVQKPVASDLAVDDILLGTVLMMGAVLLNSFGPVGNGVFFALLVIMLCIGPRWAFEALSLGFLALCTNHAFVQKTMIWAVGRFGLVLLPPIRFVLDALAMKTSPFALPFYRWLSVFCGAAAVTSVLSGNRVDLALLKVFSFWMGASGMMIGATVLRAAKLDVGPYIIKVIASSCGFSILAILLGVGQNFKDERFTGGLYNLGFYHSQTLGPMSALMLIYLANVFLFSSYRNRWICVALAGPLALSLGLSGSRTGLLTLLVGALASTLLTFAWNAHPRFQLRLNLRRSTLVIAGICLAIATLAVDVVTGNRITQGITRFAMKSGGAAETVSVEGLTASRKFLIDRGMANFRNSPIVGNGFQLYASREWADSVTILTAQVEKGFLPAALLEETGIVGAFFFCIFLASYVVYCYRERNIPGLAMFLAFLAMNLGEVVIFSLAGHGAFAWILVIAGFLLGDQCRIPRGSSPTSLRVSLRDSHTALAGFPACPPTA